MAEEWIVLMRNRRPFILSRLGFSLIMLVGFLVSSTVPAMAALPVTSTPQLALVRTIRTSPFVNSTISMKDDEGSAFVPGDNSLWLVDDNGRSVFEVSATTGELKRVLNRTVFEAAPLFGGGPAAGTNRSGDLESMAYDQVNDVLYVFSGTCCTSSTLPTAFRLMRDPSGAFRVESYRSLPSGSDFTAAAWNGADRRVYVGKGRDLRSYDYASNAIGAAFRIPNVRGILGMGFSPDGVDLFVVTNAEQLIRVNWGGRSIMPGWTLGLTPFGVGDSRGVELIGDQVYVVDGNDRRPKGDPLRHAVYVFDVLG